MSDTKRPVCGIVVFLLPDGAGVNAAPIDGDSVDRKPSTYEAMAMLRQALRYYERDFLLEPLKRPVPPRIVPGTGGLPTFGGEPW